MLPKINYFEKDFKVERRKSRRKKNRGVSRVNELKTKIENKKYLDDAISKMASDICDVFYK